MSVAFLTNIPGWPFPGSTITVRAAFGADLTASSATWTWTDITADVRQAGGGGITITRGRADEASQAQPAAGSFELDNTTGNYTAYNPASAYWPNVRRNTPVQVLIDLNDGNGPRIRLQGYATGWVPSWDTSGVMPVVTVSVAGVLRRIQQGTDAPRSPIRRFFDASTTKPLAYWPLEDGTSATSGASAVTGVAPLTAIVGGTQQAIVKFGTGAWRQQSASTGYEVLNVASEPLVSLGAGGALTGTIPAGTNGTIGWVVQFAGRSWAFDVGTDIVLARWTCAGGTYVRWDILNRASDSLFLLVGYDNNGIGTTLITMSPTTVDLSQFRVQALQVGGNISIDFRIRRSLSGFEGTVTGTTTVAGTLGWAAGIVFNPTFVVVPANPIAGSTNQTNDIVVGHVNVYQSTVIGSGAPDPCAQVSIHDGLVVAPWTGSLYEQAHTRLARLCAEEGIPLDFTDVLSAVDGTFEYGLPWTPSGCTITRSTAQAHTGTYSMQMVVTGSPTQAWARPTSRPAVTEGQPYRLTFWAYSVGGVGNFRTVIDWFNAAGSNFASTSQTWTLPAATWTLFDVTYTAAIGATSVTYGPTLFSSPANGTTVWIDDIDLRNITSSPVAMGVQPTDTPINLFRQCEAADIGVLYDGFGAGLGYICGQNRTNLPASLTADMSANQVDDPFSPVDDDQRNRNLWSVSRPNGAVPAVYQDVTGSLGTDEIGVYSDSATVNVWTDAVLADYPSWFVHEGTIEGYRYPSLNLDLVATPALVAAWVLCGMLERIDVTNPQSAAPQHPAGTVSLVLEGYTEQLDPTSMWSVGGNCSRFDAWRVLQLAADTGDTGAFIGRPDTDGSVVANTVSVSGTAVNVYTASGPLWTTTADDYPLTLSIGGITVTATAVGIILNDTFTRTTSSSWGSPDTGPAYTTSGGSASDYSTNGSVGIHNLSTTVTQRESALAMNLGPGVEVYVDWIRLPVAPTGGTVTTSVIACKPNASNYVALQLFWAAGGSVTVAVEQVSGASVTAQDVTFPSVGSVSSTYSARFHISAGLLLGQVWVRGTTPPTTWTTSIATTVTPTAGDVMLRSERASGNTNTTPYNVEWDGLSLPLHQQLTAIGSTVTRSLPAGFAVNVAVPATLAF